MEMLVSLMQEMVVNGGFNARSVFDRSAPYCTS
jgi:hypothetical protein